MTSLHTVSNRRRKKRRWHSSLSWRHRCSWETMSGTSHPRVQSQRSSTATQLLLTRTASVNQGTVCRPTAGTVSRPGYVAREPRHPTTLSVSYAVFGLVWATARNGGSLSCMVAHRTNAPPATERQTNAETCPNICLMTPTLLYTTCTHTRIQVHSMTTTTQWLS